MPNKEMPKEVSIMGGCPVPNLCSPLLFLAELEAEGKAKKARLRAQQRGRVAKGKKGRLRAALRHLWGKSKGSRPQDTDRLEVCRPPLRPYFASEIYRIVRPGELEQQDQSDCPLPPLPPEEKAR